MMVLLGVDPNLVRPGWTPLVVLVLLGIALFFLGRSMLRQFRKIDVPADHVAAPSAAGIAPRAGAADPGRRGTEQSATERTLPEAGGRPLPDLRANSEDSAEHPTRPERP